MTTEHQPARAVRLLTLVALCMGLASGCTQAPNGNTEHAGEHAGQAAEQAPKGPQGGRLLQAGDFALEVTIVERGIPPEYRLYPYRDGDALDPATVDAQITLTRLDGETNVFDFAPAGDYLRGDGVVTEPHSFDVAVQATVEGQTHRWNYASHEGRVTIKPDLAEAAGIVTKTAGPGTVRVTRTLYGRIQADPTRTAQVRARFRGLITAVNVSVGDTVERGQALVTVEADDSLQRYTLRAPIAGVVTQRMASAGEVASGSPLLSIVDDTVVWAQLAVFPGEAADVSVGQLVTIHGDGEPATGTIDWIAPMGDHGPARDARVVLDNGSGRWAPGMAVRGEVVIDTVDAPLVVENRALQAFRDFTVVFAQVGDTYEVRMLDLGASDGAVTQVLGGLKPGTRYVTGNSYLIKADIEKSGASHDH